MGLARFAAFEQGNFDGITYLDTYFLRTHAEWNEALHFHELIHVIQWRFLGPDRFLAILLEILIEHDAQMRALEQLGEQRLVSRLAAAADPRRRARADRTRKARPRPLLPCPRIRSKTASPFSSQTMASPSIRHERAGNLPTAIAINGKRAEKLFPARVISRTPAASRRASRRKPSCLISCSQPGPEGGALAGEGRHSSIMPSRGVYAHATK
jgi:hypothetical protein